MMLALIFLLLINIAGFGIFGRRTSKADEILRVGGIGSLENVTKFSDRNLYGLRRKAARSFCSAMWGIRRVSLMVSIVNGILYGNLLLCYTYHLAERYVQNEVLLSKRSQ